ncbi:hypothetical protein BRY73_15990 [Ochrobactrum sp. P6BS-III]|uniref:pyocin knob domain-containing protein n=1 Tax=unclassified Ochrobactrum TaxID=239106 RepID=UPI0009947C49|nr:hypothetical protein [Ochrobactrum sp. P6BSIII]OOL15970.1 hypothetical protein BRY73_15990 [Ochrobactrum sp. P6BS-III]
MAVLSDYVSGTITVTQNSVSFTGTNTLWRTAQFREGDTVQLKGYTAIIAASSASDPRIASNTAGTFTEPWPGPSGTFAYRMRFMPDGARVTAQTTTLIELLGNGNLQALSGVNGATKTLPYFTGAGSMDALPGAADTMPYFTGVNGMDVTPLSPFARTILDDTTAAGVYGTLGTIPNAQLPGRLQEYAPPLTDANLAVLTGFYVLNASAANNPGAGAGFLQVMMNVTTYGRQIYWQRDGSRVFSRNLTNGVWGAWQEICGGLVGQNGWTRDPDGLITQFGSAVLTLSASLAATITLPTAFPTAQFHGALLTNGDWASASQRAAQPVVVNFTNSTMQIAANGAATGTIRIGFQTRGN